jgi:hypothetical protein
MIHGVVHLATFFSVLVVFVFLLLFKAEGDKKPGIETAWTLFAGFVAGLYIASGTLHYLFILASVASVEILSRHYQAANPK